MLYGNNEARETARNEINRVYVKLANTVPTDQLNLDDIRSIMYYLRKMENALKTEITHDKIAKLEGKK